ncbi:ATP-binding protein [uncultured Sulfitobacter sp.]|uniref:sensor histidine kinase n=1 Tax=uncultured Sulfitobacter sp. TaxID=191468 RepID=UPI002624D669|nr:ATP-binding protein [uncultured Sulfitobacter sp.]
MTGLISLHELVTALPMPALAIAQTEEIVALNPAAEKLLGMDAVGRHFITALRQPSVAEAVEACLSGAKQSPAEYLTRESGSDRTYSVAVSRMGKTGAVLVLFQDVTHVSAASQMRRDFVANVSHELRTPLTALMGFIETLRGPARDDAKARARFLETMTTETERMNRLVGDLLSLSRVEADERVRPKTKVDAVAVLTAAVRTLEPIAAEGGVEFVLDVPSNGLTLCGDMDQLTQVFTNIMENAVKYGGAGKHVYVIAREEAQAPLLRGRGLVITVRDKGAGIAARHLPRLTERFYRADNHRNRALGGTGLGLAIVKHILNRHGGRIKISSKLGQGTEVIVVLPIE